LALTSSSLLSFSLAFYSPLKLSEFAARFAGGARIQSSCIVTPNYLVKKKVTFATKKIEIATPES
jgi:hypothetical protein